MYLFAEHSEASNMGPTTQRGVVLYGTLGIYIVSYLDGQKTPLRRVTHQREAPTDTVKLVH